MDITDKINIILEATFPSQPWIRSEMSKGLKDVTNITDRMAMALWHYFDPKMVGKRGSMGVNPSLIFKQGSNKTLADELWHRIGKSLEDSEHMTDDGIKKLKKNFYNIVNKWGKLYTFNDKKNAWEFTG